MFKFVSRYWRGEGNFWLCALGISLFGSLGLYWFGLQWVGLQSLHEHPRTRMLYSAIVLAMVLAVGLWQLVGTWRASAKVRAPTRWRLSRWFARLVALISAMAAAAMAVVLLGAMPKLSAMANDQDWIGQQGYTITANGDRLVLRGYFAWGLHDKFVEALRANPQIKTVVLTSPGGHVGVGMRLGAMIKARGLDTYASEMCASSCTLAFVGGARRVLRSGSKLGFHGVEGENEQMIQNGTVLATDHLRKAGVADGFITRAYAVSPKDVWFPTNDELRRANVVTDVAR